MILSRHNPERKQKQEVNLHHIVETPKREPKPVWQERYEDLKASPLWDEERHQFLEALKPNQEVADDNCPANAQLLHLLFLQQTDPAAAQHLYQQLKASKFWDKDHNQFRRSLKPNQEVVFDGRYANTQLLHLLFLQQTDPAEAQHLYQQLKASKFWDKDHNQFRWALHPNQEVWEDNRSADAQLLHILFLQQTNSTVAQRLYRQLQASKLWDEEHNQFLWSLNPNQEVGSNSRPADTQLLGILVEKGFADLEAKTPRLDVTPPMPEKRAA